MRLCKIVFNQGKKTNKKSLNKIVLWVNNSKSLELKLKKMRLNKRIKESIQLIRKPLKLNNLDCPIP
jgi:hypothetical protein